MTHAPVQNDPLEYARPAAHRARSGWGIFLALTAAYVIFTVFAIFALQLPGVGVRGQEMGVRRSVFTAVNATTLTGFQLDAGSALPGAELLRLTLTLGGTLFTLIAGGMAVTRIARMSYTDGQIAWAATVTTVAAALGGAVFLLGSDTGALASLLQSASAFGNSGLYAGRLPAVTEWRTHAILLPLAFAGGLGLPVLMELFDRLTGARRLSRHTRVVVVTSAAVYLIGVAAILLLDSKHDARNPAAPENGWRQAVAQSSTLSLNARTAGLPFEFAATLSRGAQWALIALMIVGGSPGGTAGGLKGTTLWRLFGGVRDNIGGRPLSCGFGIAASWVLGYFAILFVGFFLLLHTEPDIAADRLLFLAVSAISNVGLSHDPVSIAGDGLFTLSGLMLAGRLAPLFVLWWMVSRAEDDTVAVG